MYQCDDKLKVPRLLPPKTHRAQDRIGERITNGRGNYGDAERADRVLYPHR